MTPLTEWQNFYVVLGSAAGGLTGLQFVAMALVAEIPLAENETDTGDDTNAAFATPSIIHFSTALFLAAVFVMPWHGVTPAAIVWGLAGVAGIVYTLLTGLRLKRQSAYKPILEDWFFRIWLPLAAYAALAVAAPLTHVALRLSLFAVAAAALALLFIGIHNAWDNVTYIVFMKRKKQSA
jgi:hypothetical protein